MKHQLPPDEHIYPIVDLALSEDTGHGDATTEALIPPGLLGRATVLAKAEGVLAGIEVAAMILRRVDPSLEFSALVEDGSRIKPGDMIARVSGSVTSILRASGSKRATVARVSFASSRSTWTAVPHSITPNGWRP